MPAWVNAFTIEQCNEALADTYDLDAKLTGVWHRLICFLRKNGSVPFVERRLAMIAGVTKAYWVKTAWPTFEGVFQVIDGRLFHPEIRGLRGQGSYPEELGQRRRQAAQIAANARWGGRSNLNVVPGWDGPAGAPEAAPAPAPGDAIASESHAGNDAISTTSAYAFDAIFDAGASAPASASASPSASGSDADRMPDASAVSRADSLSQQRDSLREGRQELTESPGERARARAPVRSDAAGHAIGDATGHATQHANASESHAASHPALRPSGAKKIPIPIDWRPSLDGESEARQWGYQAADLAPGFRDYYLGHGITAADWDAMFRNWCRRQGDQDGRKRQGNIPLPIAGGASAEPPEDPAATVALLNPTDPDNARLVERWPEARAAMRTEAPEAEYRSWLRGMRLGGLDGDEIVMLVASGFVSDWVRDHYGPRINAWWKARYPAAHRVVFRVDAGG